MAPRRSKTRYYIQVILECPDSYTNEKGAKERLERIKRFLSIKYPSFNIETHVFEEKVDG